MGNYKQKTHSKSLEGNQGVTECSPKKLGVVYDCYWLVTFQPSFQITLHKFTWYKGYPFNEFKPRHLNYWAFDKMPNVCFCYKLVKNELIWRLPLKPVLMSYYLLKMYREIRMKKITYHQMSIQNTCTDKC